MKSKVLEGMNWTYRSKNQKGMTQYLVSMKRATTYFSRTYLMKTCELLIYYSLKFVRLIPAFLAKQSSVPSLIYFSFYTSPLGVGREWWGARKYCYRRKIWARRCHVHSLRCDQRLRLPCQTTRTLPRSFQSFRPTRRVPSPLWGLKCLPSVDDIDSTMPPDVGAVTDSHEDHDLGDDLEENAPRSRWHELVVYW